MSYNLSENTIDYTIEVLLRHCKNKQKFKKDIHITATGGIDTQDYTNKGIRRSRVNGKKFMASIFKNSAAAGSNFYNCTFDKCQIINANFQECSFIKSNIINNLDNMSIVHSNFNESLFSDDFSLENICFEHSVFYNTAFIGGMFENITFYSCTLEGTVFSNVTMKNVEFSDLNIDYAVFENVTMQNVVLPFSQICYTFGLLSYLKNTTDEVYVTSASNKNGFISKREFLDLIPHFIKYYTETKDFFPLANIYFFIEENKNAKTAIISGILESIAEVDFRKIKYLCKLIYVYGVFNYHERKEIMNYIYSRISFHDMHPGLMYNYSVYKKEIESYLINNNCKGVVTSEINIITNIFPDDSKNLGTLLSTIEEVIELYRSPSEEHRIVCSHNSAEAFMLTLEEIFPYAITIVVNLYCVLMGYYKLKDKQIEMAIKENNLKVSQEKNNLEIENSRLDIEIKKQELNQLKLDTEIKSMELQNAQQKQLEKQHQIRQNVLSRDINQSDIVITEMHHIIYGNIPARIDKDLIQHSYYKLDR